MIQSQSSLRSPPCPPITCVVDQRLLAVDATIDALPLHHFVGHRSHVVRDIAPLFAEFPHCPGILVFDYRQFEGLVSRAQLSEWLLNPKLNGMDQPLALLLRIGRTQPLVLSATTTIQSAATQILARWHNATPKGGSPLIHADPIVVQFDPYTYRLLDSAVLLQTAWQVQAMAHRIQMERTQVQLIQTEKMASLGRLVNGVAHEILDPVGFIWGNLCHISDYTQDILRLIHAYEAHLTPFPSDLARLREDVELDYLTQDLPKAIASIQSGADRLKKLATSLQTFCYIDEVYPKPADINNCLDSIIFLLETRLSGEIELVRQYGYLPPVTCYVGQLSYVFTNILTNIVNTLLNQISANTDLDTQMTGSLHPSSFSPPKVTITTQVWTQHFADRMTGMGKGQSPDGGSVSQVPLLQVPNVQQATTTVPNDSHRWVSITIADNGPRRSPDHCQRLINLFSAHQPTDEETSLALSYRIVTTKHNGRLLFRSPIDDDSTADLADFPITPAYSELAYTAHDARLPGGTAFQILLPLS